MKLLERVSLTLSDTQRENAHILSKMQEYLAAHAVVQASAKLLVQSKIIEEAVSQEDAPREELTPAEKTPLIMLLNKRLSQISNRQEKVEQITRLIVESVQQMVPQHKIDSFVALLINRIIEQAQVQVSTNKASALGYALFLMYLSQVIPTVIPTYKKVLFKSVLPLDCLMGMYRIYFTMLHECNAAEESWSFISALLEHSKDIDNTFNPCVLSVFLEVLNKMMHQRYKTEWIGVLEHISSNYLPKLSNRFATEVCCIKSILNARL